MPGAQYLELFDIRALMNSVQRWSAPVTRSLMPRTCCIGCRISRPTIRSFGYPVLLQARPDEGRPWQHLTTTTPTGLLGCTIVVHFNPRIDGSRNPQRTNGSAGMTKVSDGRAGGLSDPNPAAACQMMPDGHTGADRHDSLWHLKAYTSDIRDDRERSSASWQASNAA